MRRSSAFVAAFAALALALAPGLGFARAGSGGSFGSRGSRTFSAPPVTRTAPYSAAPMERSATQAPSYAPNYANQARPGFGGRFGGAFLGGLLGVGLGSMLFGHGMFGGFLNLLFWLVILFFGARLLMGLFARGRQPALAGNANRFARTAAPGAMPGGAMPGGGGARPGVTVTRADYQAFEQLLQAVQAAWSAQDLARLRPLATPEMTSYFAEQLADQASRGQRNEVTGVHLDQGDLSEAWVENGREYATVAMRFSMNDVTRDSMGRIVDGDPSVRTQAVELWTFMRTPGGRWILSAIQQGR